MSIIPDQPLISVIDLVRLANCGQCWQRPGKPCTVAGPPDDHLAGGSVLTAAGSSATSTWPPWWPGSK